MNIADKLKRRRREEQEQHSYASSSRWYTGLSNVISFLDHAENEDDAVNRFRDAWTAADTLSQMYVERGEEEFKGFDRWVTSIKDHPSIQRYFAGKADDVPLDAYRADLTRAKNSLLEPPRHHELLAWSKPSASPEKACRYFFNISRDVRNRLFHGDVNPGSQAIKKALSSGAQCLVPIIATAAQIIIERPVDGTTGRATAYRFFLYPFLKNSDGFFSDYYLEHLFPNEELGDFPEEQARDVLKSVAKQLETREVGLKQADSEETLKAWCDPALFEVLKIKPDPGVRIVTEDAVFEPTLVLRRADAAALRSEYRGKDAAKDIAALLWILPWRTTLDAVSTDPAFESVPVTEVVHGALARSDVPWAIVTNGRQLRLLSKASAHRPRRFLEADLGAIVDRRSGKQALQAFRFFLGLFSGSSLTEVDEAGKTRLDRVVIGSERHGKEIGDELKQNVYGALEELGEGFLYYLRARPTDLDFWRERKATKLSRERFLASDELLEDIYHESLSLMYRLLFLFYAESRGLLPLDNDVYQTYSLDALRYDVHSVLDDPDPKAFFAKGSTDLWQRLTELFKFLDKGWGNIIPAYNGGLFDPEKHEFLERFAVGDHYLAHAIDLLSRTRPRADQSRGEGRKKVTYRDLDVRHLGSIYEGILEYSAHIADQDYVVMRAGSAGSAEDYVAAGDLTREQKQQLSAWREAVEENPDNPKLPRGCKVTGRKEKGQYYLVYGGRESKRKSSGSYYTPDYIVQYIVESTVGPLVRGECRPQPEALSEEIERELKKIGVPEERRPTGKLTSDEVLEIKVLDPAMGSGHFLVAATEYLARAYREACLREGKTLGEAGADQEFMRAKRMIAERCIYGVDLNPMAVELAKLSMWLFTMDPGRPLSFLDHHLKCGNALAGAWIRDLGQLPRFNRSCRPVPTEAVDQRNLFERQFQVQLPTMLKDIFGILKRETLTPGDIDVKKALDRAISQIKRPFCNIANAWTATFFNEQATDYLSLLSRPELAKERQSLAAASNHFFHWELEFPEAWYQDSGARKRENIGFSAAIGNPPYLLIESFGRQAPEAASLSYLYKEIWQDKTDLAMFFLYRALQLGERTCLIVKNSVLAADKARRFRKRITDEFQLHFVLDFRDVKVFQDAQVATCIIGLSRSDGVDYYRLRSADVDLPEVLGALSSGGESVEVERIRTNFRGDEPWTFREAAIDVGTNAAGFTSLGSVFDVGEGMQTGCNSVFEISADSASDVPSFCRPRIEGKLVQRYWIDAPRKYLLWAEDAARFEDLPTWIRHLLSQHREELRSRAAFMRGNCDWFRFTWPLHKEKYSQRKIWTAYRGKRNAFALDNVEMGIGLTDTTVIFGSGREEWLHCLVGLLNSIALNVHYRTIGKMTGGGVFEYFKNGISKLLIPPEISDRAPIRLDASVQERLLRSDLVPSARVGGLPPPRASEARLINLSAIDLLAKERVKLGKANKTADAAAALEACIDELACRLYGMDLDQCRASIGSQA